MTDASVHDRYVFTKLLDMVEDEKTGKKRTVYAGRAYRSQGKEDQLSTAGIASKICEKALRHHPLTDEKKASNTEKSSVRARVEHVLGAQAQMGGHPVRTIGLLRAEVKIGMMSLVYNMVHLGKLLRRDRIDVPAVALNGRI